MSGLPLSTIGRWYDPISERWITPVQRGPQTVQWYTDRGSALDADHRVEAERIWDALLDCCSRG